MMGLYSHVGGMCFVVASILFWFIELLQTDSVSDCFAHHKTNIKHTDTHTLKKMY